MTRDGLAASLYEQICQIPLIDPHTHIDPHRPAARSLDDILGYHYYTELAHSAGMDKAPLAPTCSPRERVRAILAHMDRYDNTAQYQWFLEIARTLLGFQGDRLTASDADALCDEAEKRMARPDWEAHVLKTSNLRQVFLTNEFDDALEGFDTTRYVPCLRTDDLVFKLDQPSVQQRLAKATGIEAGSTGALRKAVTALFDHFTRKNAKACAISLPPGFSPLPVGDPELNAALRAPAADTDAGTVRARGVFWMLAEHCQSYRLPFDLMIGVNRRVYRDGVYQGQDLFDGRMSLIQYAELFNAFPTVPFCTSVLSSGLNQELVSYSWIFPNVITSGHWWYSNIPVYIEQDLRARLEAVPRTKQIGYYSDMYKLEFALPKYNMYRRVLAKVLAEQFVRPGALSEARAVELARTILLDNVKRIFGV
ncbi:MAG: glucuronate isomerase [Gemmataceae bacterium]